MEQFIKLMNHEVILGLRVIHLILLFAIGVVVLRIAEEAEE